MKTNRRIAVGIVIWLYILLVPAWVVSPMLGPILGTSRSAEEIMEYIQSHNLITLVDPVPYIKTEGYHEWAYHELLKRRNVALFTSAFFIGIVSIRFYMHRKNKKMITKNACEPRVLAPQR
ncbi:hypothetical protein P3T73_06860 [Kiritimatiellota bacterium B12222]|nr:hypothetical protein P3T73_06860 [Kiritimatiellota bacterium B12222]